MKAKDLVKKGQELVSVNPEISMKNLLNVLKENNILSVPILEENRILGFIDVLDISAFALHIWHRYNRFYWSSMQKFSEFKLASEKFFNTPARDVINWSARDAPPLISVDGTAAEILKALERRAFKTHRVGLINDDNNQLVNMVTQSDVLRFAAKNMEHLPMIDQPIKDLNLVRSCVMVRFDIPFIESLSILAQNRISGLALVDFENKLLANFSATDLRGLLPNCFDMFHATTLEFLRQGTETKSKIPPISCLELINLREVIEIFAAEKVHRLFVVDKDNHLLGVVSLTDVMQILTRGISIEE